MNAAGLYLHIPFCLRRCFYCHFFTRPYSPGEVERYMDFLQRELKLLARLHPRRLSSIYLGGGSPSLLPPLQLQRIMDRVAELFPREPGLEVTLEANPSEVSKEAARAWRGAGINRVSLGVQSFRDRDLKFLRRNHDAAAARRALKVIQRSGFRVSADLIIGLPTLDPAGIFRNLDLCRREDIRHLSVYLLERAPGRVDDETAVAHYHHARRHLEERGYRQYEISNYGRSGERARHNLEIWRGGEYLSAGMSACGYLAGTDTTNATGAAYYRELAKNRLPVAHRRRWDPVERRIICGLRLREGVETRLLAHREKEVTSLLEGGILERRDERVRVAAAEQPRLDEILSYLVGNK